VKAVEHRQPFDPAILYLRTPRPYRHARAGTAAGNDSARGPRAGEQRLRRRAIDDGRRPVMSFCRVGANRVRRPAFDIVRRRSDRQSGGHLEKLAARQVHGRIIEP
jgi:hypothetical protein